MTFKIKLKLNDRVQVKKPENRDDPWHTYGGSAYANECKPGWLGTVDRVNRHESVHVVWDEGGTSNIDITCLELEADEAELDAEAARLFGIKPKSDQHCPTCTC